MKVSFRYIRLFSTLLLYSWAAHAQTPWIDSAKIAVATQKADTNKVFTLIGLSNAYQLLSPDSSFAYAQQALALAETLQYEAGVFWSEVGINGALIFIGNYPMELDYAFKALSLSKKLNMPRVTGFANGMLSDCYYNLGEYTTSLSYWNETIKIAEKRFPDEMYVMWAVLSRIYRGMNQPDSAMLYAKKAYEKIKPVLSRDTESVDNRGLLSLMSTMLGNAFAGKANYDSALFYYHMGIPFSTNIHMEINVMDGYNGIAAVYRATGKLDSAVWYAEKVLTDKIAKSYPVSTLKAANLLSEVYELKNKPDSTLKYLRMAIGLKDSLFNREKMIAIQNLTYKEQEKQKEIEAVKLKLQNRLIMYLLLTGLVILLVAAGIFLRNKRLRQLRNMRNSIADDLHDDIGSTLSSISIMNELAKTKSPEALSLLSSIGESTSTLQENMSDIVWAVNPKNDRMENVLRRMNEFASEILDAKNIELDFKSDASLSTSRITMGQRKNFYLFFKEAINNAAKYSDAKKVAVYISQKEHHVEMNIRDNGKGFDTNKISGGNGMNTLRRRGADLGADLKIESHINKGTGIQLKFKII